MYRNVSSYSGMQKLKKLYHSLLQIPSRWPLPPVKHWSGWRGPWSLRKFAFINILGLWSFKKKKNRMLCKNAVPLCWLYSRAICDYIRPRNVLFKRCVCHWKLINCPWNIMWAMWQFYMFEMHFMVHLLMLTQRLSCRFTVGVTVSEYQYIAKLVYSEFKNVNIQSSVTNLVILGKVF